MDHEPEIRSGILVLRCQQGDGEAFAELVAYWHRRLLAHACRLTGEPQAAADVVQEAWMAAAKGLARLADADAFPCWIHRIVTHKAADWVRRARRQRGLAAELSGRERERARVAPADAANRRAIETLSEALEHLPPVQRAVIGLYYVDGFSTDEIAEIVGIPRGTVKSRLHAARERIRALVEGRTDGEQQPRDAEASSGGSPARGARGSGAA